ncbi:hypothetical protein IFM89_006381 [Coptis chinensis]|uniref:Ribonuclease H1 N-terminal domain-containing protein n=1 Tax=Coptis chinensis TaxID=261450 RepID=A0A835LV23_9MAGN|nr:hypothetical protein IFM89_006381 [Coptis chinensis]
MAKFCYAVIRGWQPGIYRHWSSCSYQVHKLAGQDYIGCNSIEEAELLLRKKGINNYYDEFNLDIRRDNRTTHTHGVFKRTIPSIDEAMTDVPYGMESKLGNGIGGLFAMLEAKVIVVSFLSAVFMT